MIHAACHCGAVTFEIEQAPPMVTEPSEPSRSFTTPLKAS